MSHGPRITDGGYQGPATDSVQLKRGKPIRQHKTTIGSTQATLEVIPLEHGRPGLCEVSLLLNDPERKTTVYVPCMLRGRELVDRAYELTLAELDAGRLPDRILLPAGAPVGW